MCARVILSNQADVVFPLQWRRRRRSGAVAGVMEYKQEKEKPWSPFYERTTTRVCISMYIDINIYRGEAKRNLGGDRHDLAQSNR